MKKFLLILLLLVSVGLADQNMAKSTGLTPIEEIDSFEQVKMHLIELQNTIDKMHRQTYGDINQINRDEIPALESSIAAVDIDFDIPLIGGLNFTWNAGTSKIDWDAGTVEFGGTSYSISSGSSVDNAITVYLDVSSLSSPVTLGSTTTPTVVDDRWYLCSRITTTVYEVLQSPIIHGGLIQANTVLADQIDVGNLFAEDIELTGSIYAGNSAYASNEDFWLGIDSADSDKTKFRIGDASTNLTVVDGTLTLRGVGGNATYAQSGATPPSSPVEGDTWYITTTSGGYTLGETYRRSSSAWVLVADLMYSTDITAGKIVLSTATNDSGWTEGATWGTDLNPQASFSGGSGLILTTDGLGFYDQKSTQLKGTSHTGTFIMGERVEQASTGATGVVSNLFSQGAHTIFVLRKGAAFNTTDLVTGAESSATITPSLIAGGSAYVGFSTFIASNGSFFFNGDADSYIGWDGDTLNIRGSIVADDIIAGTFTLADGSTLPIDSGTADFNGGDFTCDTLTAKTSAQIGPDIADGKMTITVDSGIAELRTCENTGSSYNILVIKDAGLECYSRMTNWPTTNSLADGSVDHNYKRISITGDIYGKSAEFGGVVDISHLDALYELTTPKYSTAPTAYDADIYYNTTDNAFYGGVDTGGDTWEEIYTEDTDPGTIIQSDWVQGGTYTGNGSATQAITHGLGRTPRFIIVGCYSNNSKNTQSWTVNGGSTKITSVGGTTFTVNDNAGFDGMNTNALSYYFTCF